MPLHDVDTLDPASLDRFRAELAAAGFRGREAGRVWTGPIEPPLRSFTDAEEMTITVRDGWPYVDPTLTVEGMPAIEHVNEGGVVCLWQRGDPSRQWMTLAGLRARIAEWCLRQQEGFGRRDETTDTHRYFELPSGRRAPEVPSNTLATVHLAQLVGTAGDGDSGRLSARQRHDGPIEISPARSGGPIKGRWFFRESIPAPPRSLPELRALLTDNQRQSFGSVLGTAARNDRLVVLAWRAGRIRNAMAILLMAAPKRDRSRRDARATPVALELAPTDTAYLLARAGGAAKWLPFYDVVVFGAGAVGSYAAMLLAESGAGGLTLVDDERLRPANVVRHAAGAEHVGRRKCDAVSDVIAVHAPWTRVRATAEAPWEPARLRELASEHDLVIDATGNTGFTEQLSLALHDREPLVSAALYRRGSVARVSRQALGDILIVNRGEDHERYPIIPRGADDEQVTLEPGCSAPVNDAPPSSVVGCARLAAAAAIDELAGIRSLADEVVEVFRPLEEAPFDRIGTLRVR